MKKDYYEIIGLTEEDKKLPKEEFQKKLKSLYKKLAVKYHPDRNDGSKEAEEKFKDITEAYETLSDDSKRRMYDLGDMADFSDMHGGFGGFDSFMNPFHGKRQKPTFIKGDNITLQLELTLEQCYRGCKMKVKYNKLVLCPECGGGGGETEECPHCHGQGVLRSIEPSPFGVGQMISEQTCPYCRGGGYIITKPCKKCGGSGLVQEKCEQIVEIPAGAIHNSILNIQGEGNFPSGKSDITKIPGDVLIVIKEKKDEFFQRDPKNPFDLRLFVYLSITEAMLGCQKEITCIDGNKVKMSFDTLTPNGKVYKLAGKGMPVFNNNKEKGDLYVTVKYTLPKELTPKQKELLKEFEEIEKIK